MRPPGWKNPLFGILAALFPALLVLGYLHYFHDLSAAPLRLAALLALATAIPVGGGANWLVERRFVLRTARRLLRAAPVLTGLGRDTERARQESAGLADEVRQQQRTLQPVLPAARRLMRELPEAKATAALLRQLLAEQGEQAVAMAATWQEQVRRQRQWQESQEGVSGAAGELGRVSHTLREGVTALDASVAQARRAVTGIDESLHCIRQGADQTSRLTQTAEQEVAWGGEAVRGAATGVTALCDTLEEAGRTIDALGRRAEAVGRVLRLVTDLAAQTDLLALNASLIASQSGEQGQGFAIIAGEIRELAERTGEAIEEIDHITEDVRLGIRQATSQMQEGIDRARGEAGQAHAAHEALVRLRSDIRQAAEQISGIVRAVGEQADESHQLSQTMAQSELALERLSEVVRQQEDEVRQLGGAGRQAAETALELGGAANAAQRRGQQLAEALAGLQQRAETLEQELSGSEDGARRVAAGLEELERAVGGQAEEMIRLDALLGGLGRRCRGLRRGLEVLRR